MPQLLFRGVEPQRLAEVSEELVRELADICECGTDNFTIDCIMTAAVYGGTVGGGSFPFAEIGWFERGTATRNQFAEAVTRKLREAGVNELEIAFRVYREDSYYIDGKSCE
ncbi:DUF1904 family protein [Paenibacillus sp. NPDC058071]|uniref:DUF1904 family protein n=1 Tax=Paenibacillus sp. NPDC058071 TaxID=3346326 RepID=UPI0036DD68AE